MINAPSFDDWFVQLQELAFEVEWELGEPHEYQEYFDDGDLPGEALAEEMSRFDKDDDYEPTMEDVNYEH